MNSSPIEFRCQNCGRRLRIGRGKLGKLVACPRCKQKTEVVLSEDGSDGDELSGKQRPAQQRPAQQRPAQQRPAQQRPAQPTAPPTSDVVPIQLVHDLEAPSSRAATPTAATARAAATDGAATDGAATDGAATDGAATDGAATDGAATDDEPAFSLTKSSILALGILVVALPVVGFGLGWLAGRAVPVVQATRTRQPAFFAGEVVDASGAPDSNAVVLLFSERNSPQSSDRLIVETLRPNATPLKPSDTVVRQLRSFDADTTRTDSLGRFTVRAPDVGRYYLLVLSSKQNSQPSVIPRSDIAQLGRYVDRPADLIRNQRYRWEPIEIDTDRYEYVVQLP